MEGFVSWDYSTPGLSFKFRSGRITIFKTTLDILGRPEYFQFMFSPEDRMFAIQACEMGDDGAHRMPEVTPRDYIEVNSKALVRFVYRTCGWNEKYTYRIPGVNMLIDTDDNLQLSEAGGRIYSMDFSDAFYVSDTMMLKAFLFNEDAGIAWMRNKLGAFCKYQTQFSFDVPEFAVQLGLDPAEMKAGIITAAKKVLDITEEELSALSDELMELYPAGYAVYYEECIHAIQNKMRKN